MTVLPPAPRHLAALLVRDRKASRIDEDIDAARMAEIEARAHRACVELLPSLYGEPPDDFLTELAGLPEIARVLRGAGA